MKTTSSVFKNNSKISAKYTCDGEGKVQCCSPSGMHRYFFKLYALDTILNLDNPDKEILEKAMQGHIINSAELIGFYNRI